LRQSAFRSGDRFASDDQAERFHRQFDTEDAETPVRASSSL
jgi:hypothetical protein